MTKLTEHTVLARTRAQDLRSVRKLNAWGSELTDVSIVRNLPNVEVLSLSVNCICSLVDFAHCNNLQELYLRKNNIADLGEIRHLQDLPKLRNLWLADNPCADVDQYRFTVIRALPQLQKLDNMTIRPDEIDSAKLYGNLLEAVPSTIQPPEQSIPIESSVNYEESFSTETHSSSISVESTAITRTIISHPSPLDTFPPKLEESIQIVSKSPVIEEAAPQIQFKNQENEHNFENSAQHYINTESQNNCSFVKQPLMNPEESKTPCEPEIPLHDRHLDLVANDRFTPRCTFTSSYAPRHHRSDRTSPFRMLPKGGKNRNANILSAVLCLIKELDWPSLEVVDTAIHCQMEEMEADINSS